MKYKGVRNYLLSNGLSSTAHTPLCVRAGAAGLTETSHNNV